MLIELHIFQLQLRETYEDLKINLQEIATDNYNNYT